MPLAAGGRLEKCAGTPFPIKTTAPLNGRQRHPKGLNDLSLGGGSIDNELGGEKPKAAQIVNGMREHGQMPIEINHLVVATLKSKFRRNGGGPGRKYGQLKLWHAKNFPSASRSSKPKKPFSTRQVP